MAQRECSNNAESHGFFFTFSVFFVQIAPRQDVSFSLSLSLSLSDDVGRLPWTNYTNVSCVNKSDPSYSSEPYLMVRRRYAPCYSLGASSEVCLCLTLLLPPLRWKVSPALSVWPQVKLVQRGTHRKINKSLPEGLINVY